MSQDTYSHCDNSTQVHNIQPSQVRKIHSCSQQHTVQPRNNVGHMGTEVNPYYRETRVITGVHGNNQYMYWTSCTVHTCLLYTSSVITRQVITNSKQLKVFNNLHGSVHIKLTKFMYHCKSYSYLTKNLVSFSHWVYTIFKPLMLTFLLSQSGQ